MKKKNISGSKDKQKFISFFYIKVYGLIITFTVLLLSLLNTFKVPYAGDDRMNNLTRGALIFNNRSIYDHTKQLAEMWMQGGRFFPLGFYSYGLFNALPDLLSYRLFLLFVNLTAVALFAYLIYEITYKWTVTFFSIMMTAIFFQFRDYHDAILGFHGLLQIVSIFVFLALIFQIKSIKKRKNIYGIISGIFFFLSLLVYEVSYSFIAIFMMVAMLYCKSFKNKFKYIIPQCIALIIGVVPTLYLRTKAGSAAYSGTKFSFDLLLIIKTFLKQFSATTPLSYLVSTYDDDRLSYTNFIDHMEIYHFVLLFVFFAATISCLIYFVKKEYIPMRFFKTKYFSDETHEPNDIDKLSEIKNLPTMEIDWEKNLLLIGFVIMAAPAAILSLSSRYQEELQWGLGYLPVYVQNFGGICIVVSVIFSFFRLIKRNYLQIVSACLLSVCCTIFLLFTILSNQVTIEKMVKGTMQPVSNFAASENLLANVEENARFLMVQGGLGPELDPGNFVAKYADGLKINPMTMEQLLVECEETAVWNDEVVTLFPENLYGFCSAGTLENGIASLFIIDSLDYSPKDKYIRQAYTTQLKTIYVGWENQTKLYIPRLDMNGGMSACYVWVQDIRVFDKKSIPIQLDTGERYTHIPDSKNGLEVFMTNFIGNAPEGIRKIFQMDQGNSFMFEIHSEQYPILVRGMGLIEESIN